MNQGKRQIRNTVLALYGAVVVFVGMNRLNAAVVDDDTPRWLRTAMTLGLRENREPEPAPEIDLATVKDFSRVVVTGRYSLEIIGAAQYKVTLLPVEGAARKLHASRNGDTLHLHGDQDDLEGDAGTIQIETPTLQQVHMRVNHLTIRGLQAETLEVRGMGRGDVTLLQNRVANWRLISGAPMEVRVDDATFAAGSLKGNGDVVMRRTSGE